MSESQAADPIRWGILGSGRVAEGFAIGLESLPDAALVAVASRRMATARAFSARHGGVTVHDSYADLAADPGIDVVYVATPNHRHASDALMCLKAGKAVLCEKPFATESTAARAVVTEARSRALFCMEAMWMRFIPSIVRATELVASGAIGDIRTLHADFSGRFAVDPTSRLFDPVQGGGALLDLGVYTLSLAQLLLGEPTEVKAHVDVGPTGVDESAAVLLGYPSGASAMLTSSLRSHGPNEAVIAGSRGTIRIPGPICAPSSLVVTPVEDSDPVSRGPTGRLGRVLRDHPRLYAGTRTARRLASAVAANRGRVLRFPIEASGYNYEAAEVNRCLRAGVSESAIQPLDQTLRLIELLDSIRSGK